MARLLTIFILLGIVYNAACQDRSNELETKVNGHWQEHPVEKVYVHTDKNFYLAGETIWFKVYLADGSTNQPLDVSSIVYTELLDEKMHHLFQLKIDMKDGEGVGSFTIPVSSSSGNYMLRAYTNWMKNENPLGFFHTSLTVMNTLKNEKIQKTTINDSISINFFPEGGDLVNGLSSLVAFELTDHYGNVVNGAGIILNQRKDTVAKFVTASGGMGSFLFKPVAGESYTARVNNDNHQQLFSLPVIRNKGYVLSVKNIGNKLKVSVSSNAVTQMSNVYLLLHTRQIQKALQVARLNENGSADFTIDIEKAGDGVSHLILFDNELKPVAERLVFKQPGKLYTASISTSDTLYKRRQKVAATVALPVELQHAAKLSISVFLLDSLQKEPSENIVSFLLLNSELDRRLGCGIQYLKTDTSNNSNLFYDLLMLTHGWRKFKWKEKNDSTNNVYYLPEAEGQIIEARVTNKVTGMPAKGITVYATAPGTKFTFTSAVSDNKGNCLLILKKIHGRHEMILQADSGYSIETKPFFSESFTQLDKPEYIVFNRSRFASQLLQRSIDMQAQNSYNKKQKHQYEIASEDSLVFYGKPDKRYYLDEYTRFPTMEEVIKEFVKDVLLRKNNDRYYLRVTNTESKTFFDNEPLILLDGIPVTNTNKIIEMSPLKIRNIDIVAGRYYFGSLVNEGIVSFFTYDGTLGGYELDPNSIVFDYDGIQQQQEFYAPAYETELQKTSRLPDFRNVLYWNPSISLLSGQPKVFNFNTSDRPGMYYILLQGLSQKGIPLSGSAVITVTK